MCGQVNIISPVVGSRARNMEFRIGAGRTDFHWPVRVYYEDTDSGGVVYYANYLRFFERARTEWLRQLGFEQDELRANSGIIFSVCEVQLAYHRPARFNDRLNVVSTISQLRKASVMFAQQVHRVSPGTTETESLLCSGTIRVACVHAEAFRPLAIPRELWEMMDGVKS